MQIGLGDARDKLSQLVQAVLDGEQVTILRHGEPVVDIVRTEHREREVPKFGTLAGKGVIVDPDWHKGPETDQELIAWLDGRFE
jgi:prevent-host-death family protein